MSLTAPALPRSAENHPLSRLFFFAALLAFVLCLPVFDGMYLSLSTDFPLGYGLCAADKHGLVVGRDMITLYGPWPHLYRSVAMSESANHSQFLAFMLAMTAFHALGMLLFVRRTRRYVSAALFLVVHTTFLTFNTLPDFSFITLMLPLFFEDFYRRRGGLFVLLAALSALAMMGKFNIGAVMGMTYIVHTLGRQASRREPLKAFALRIAAYPALLACWVLAAYGAQFAPFFNYVRGSIEAARGYSIHMTMTMPFLEVATALGLFPVFFVLVPFLMRRGSPWTDRSYWIAFSSLLYIYNLRHSFALQDVHFVYFVALTPVLAAAALWFLPARLVICFLIPVSIIVTAARPINYDFLASFKEIGERGVGSLFYWKGSERDAVAENNRYISEEYVTESVFGPFTPQTVETVGRGTIDTTLYYIPIIDQMNMRWKPSPYWKCSFSYSARQDLKNAEFYSSPQSADYYALTWESMLGLHPFYGMPATHLALFGNYTLVEQQPQYLLLKKIPPRRVTRKLVETVRGVWEEPLAVPATNRMLLASIRAPLTLRGMFKSLFFRVSPTIIFLQSDMGEGTGFRFTTTTSPNGIMVSRFPASIDQAATLFEHGLVHPQSPLIQTILLSQEVPGDFRKTYLIDFYEIDFGAP